MAQHRENAEFDGPFADDDPIGRLLEFYMANGYRVVDRERVVLEAEAEAADDSEEVEQPAPDAPLAKASFERGRKGAGWWTSDMTGLHTRVELVLDGDLVGVDYQVDTSGQMLTDIERAFWRRERQAARHYMNGDQSEPRDLREDEAERAKKQKANLFSIGLWGAVAIFVLVVFLGFIGLI